MDYRGKGSGIKGEVGSERQEREGGERPELNKKRVLLFQQVPHLHTHRHSCIITFQSPLQTNALLIKY